MTDEIRVKEALASLMKQKGEREAFAQLLVEYINPNHITENIVGMLMNTRTLKPGDALVKKVRKGIRVFTHVPGAIPLRSEVTVSDRINFVLDMAVVGITANEWELESGELGTVSELRREALAALKDFYIGKVFNALSTIWNTTNTPNNFTTVSGAISKAALDDAIRRINNTTPKARAIVGSRAALTPITEFGAFWTSGSTTWGVDSQLEEVMKTGWLGTYLGVPVIAISQVYNNPEDNTKLIPENLVMVVGDNVGEFILYGDPKYKEWVDNRPTPPQWNMDIYQQFGMIIDNAEGIYVIKIV